MMLLQGKCVVREGQDAVIKGQLEGVFQSRAKVTEHASKTSDGNSTSAGHCE